MSIDSELDSILADARLSALFQPIVACRDASLFGYEALIRGPSTSPLHSPLKLFDAASRSGRLVELDLLCRQVAISRFMQLGLPGRLFLNVTPTTVVQTGFRRGETMRFLKKASISPDRVVIELTEQVPIHDYQVMRAAVEHYRSMGFSIAIDDLGAGYSSLRHWAELRPDFVKLDRHFVQGVDQDEGKRRFIRSILEMSKSMGCRVIAEGIETLEEYRNLWSMGLEFGQGYYFARPQAVPPQVLPGLLPAKGEVRSTARARFGETVSSVTMPVPPVAPDQPAELVAQRLQESPALRTLPVVDNGRPVGIIHRNAFMSLFAGQYGRALYGKRPCLQVASSVEPMIVAADMPVEELSQQITAMSELAGDQDFVVVDSQGDYIGIGTIMGLLRKITELQIRNARYANPLTGLPGNVPLSERIECLLSGAARFVVAYCDLDGFKAFNDCYGYSRGDDIIVRLAELLQDHAEPGADLVGHIGGDDFMVIFQSPDWAERCQRVLDDFAELVPWFYEPQHRVAGGIQGRDRQGREMFFPYMSLSIAVVPVAPGAFQSRHEIASVLSELKGVAKRTPGNSLYVDRRQATEGLAACCPAPVAS